MHVVNVDDVDVGTEWLCDQLQLLVLVSDLPDQVISLLVHRLQEILQEFSFVVDPRGLVLYLTDGVALWVADEKDIFHPLLVTEFVQRIGLVVTDLLEYEWLLAKNLFLVVVVIDDLDRDLVRWLCNVECQVLAPLGSHAVGLLDLASVFHFFDFFSYVHLVDLVPRLPNDFYHWFESVGVEELLIELAIHNCKSECASFHDWDAVDEVASGTLF